MTTTAPDLLELYEAREYEKIEAILDSAEYTRAEKITMITNKKNLFSKLMRVHSHFFKPIPIELSIKVLRIFGENLGNHVDELKNIVTIYLEEEGGGEEEEEQEEKLVKVIVEELSDFQFTDVLTSLLVHSLGNSSVAIVNVLLSSESVKQNILTKESIEYSYDITTKQTNEYFCSDGNVAADKNATLIEIALHKHVDIEIIRALVRVGGKDLLSLSETSLIEGAMIEYNNHNKDEAVEIVKLFLEVGGKDLVMKEKSWHERDAHAGLNILEYLCENGKYYLNRRDVAEVMTKLLDTGGKDLVMKKNINGQTILHYFKYFNHHSFISSPCMPVVEKIKKIGGVDLLSIADNNGDTVLHTLAKFYPQNKSDHVVGLQWWEILACNRDLVMMQNKDGKTALHVACENSEFYAIKVLVEKGGRDLVWKRDNQMNTALHLLSFRVSREKDADNFQALKHIIEVGGMKLLHSFNNKEKKPVSPFFIDAIEFQFDEENRRAQVKALQEKAELDRKEKLNLEKQLQMVQKKKKSLKNKLKDQKKNNEVTIKEFQKEKENERVNDKTKADINNQLKDEIKQLQGKQQSLQSKLQEKQDIIENLQVERKQADLEFEIVKTMHEENKNAYEQSLVEVRKLKEVEKSQQDDICDQKEMIQKLQCELRKLETENQRLREFNDKEEVPYADKPSSIQEESQRLIEEVKANIDEVSSIENRVHTLEEENKILKDAVKEQKQIATEKQNENKALKDENERLIDQIATSSSKRSRGEETEEIDCIEEDEDDIYCSPTKRGKLTPASSETRTGEDTKTYQIDSLENEIEELMNDLEYEKSSHMKTLKRLKEARKSSKKNLHQSLN